MIRQYRKTDYPTIAAWAKQWGISTLTPETLPSSTYLFEYEGVPVVSLSLILTNTKDMAYLEYFIANPEFKSDKRPEMSHDLCSHVENIAKSMGYNKIRCLAPNNVLAGYYSSFGYTPNLEGLTLMVKEI